MQDIPNLAEKPVDPIVIRDGSRFLAELHKDDLIKSLSLHTCEAVNTEQKPTFMVRISQTKKGGKIVVSFTHNETAICFLVRSSHKFRYDVEKIIASITRAAARCNLEVLDMCKHRPVPLEPVRYGKNSREKSRRGRFNLRPEFSRKPQHKKVAAS